jgi:hypothetical protein
VSPSRIVIDLQYSGPSHFLASSAAVQDRLHLQLGGLPRSGLSGDTRHGIAGERMIPAERVGRCVGEVSLPSFNLGTSRFVSRSFRCIGGCGIARRWMLHKSQAHGIACSGETGFTILIPPRSRRATMSGVFQVRELTNYSIALVSNGHLWNSGRDCNLIPRQDSSK